MNFQTDFMMKNPNSLFSISFQNRNSNSYSSFTLFYYSIYYFFLSLFYNKFTDNISFTHTIVFSHSFYLFFTILWTCTTIKLLLSFIIIDSFKQWIQLIFPFFSKYASILWRKKNALPYSNEVIIIAHAGATLTTRGVTPANTPFMPFCWKICRKIVIVPTFGKDFTGLSANRTFSPNSICLWVFTTSNGAVRKAAT